MLLVTTPRFEPRSTGVRAIVAGLQVRAATPTVDNDKIIIDLAGDLAVVFLAISSWQQ